MSERPSPDDRVRHDHHDRDQHEHEQADQQLGHDWKHHHREDKGEALTSLRRSSSECRAGLTGRSLRCRRPQPSSELAGEPGAVGVNWLLPGGHESRAERLPDTCTIQLKAGDVLRMVTPGGGGWGSAPVSTRPIEV